MAELRLTPGSRSPRRYLDATHTWYFDSGAAVYDRRLRRVYALSNAEAAVWLLADGTCTIDSIVTDVASAFAVDPHTIVKAVEDTLSGFEAWNLLVPTDAVEFAPALDEPVAPRPKAGSTTPLGPTVGPFRAPSGTFTVETEANLARAISTRFADLLVEEPEAAAAPYLVRIGDCSDPQQPASWLIEIEGMAANLGSEDDAILQALCTALLYGPMPKPPLSLHGAAAAHGDRAVVLIGPPGAGKTTTLIELLRHGWSYLADEVVTVDPGTFRVRPFALPVSLSAAHWERLGITPTLPDGAQRFAGCHEPLPVSSFEFGRLAPETELGAVVLVDHRPGTPTSLRPMAPAEVVAQVYPRLLAPAIERESWLDDLAGIAARTPGYWLSVDDLGPVPELLAAVVAGRKSVSGPDAAPLHS